MQDESPMITQSKIKYTFLAMGLIENWTIARRKVLIQSHKYIQTAPSEFNKGTSMQE